MPTNEANRRRRQIMTEIAHLGFCLPGSVVERTSRCASPGCGCQSDPDRRHGPYRLWTRKVAGKTVTKSLSPEQLERYRPWFDNARRLHELVAELEHLSTVTMARAESWPEPPIPPPDGRRARRDAAPTPPAVGDRRT